MRTTTLMAGGLLLMSFGVIVGCGPFEAEVTGEVKMDGVPLKEGDIIFEEADKSVTPAMGKIVDGQYKLKVMPGSKVVRINASRATKVFDPVMGAAARESMIPEEFNIRSTLKCEVKPGKQDGINFAVDSIPES